MVDTKNYILVCSLGILFIVGYNVVCGILRGLGDSKTPLYFVGLACVINIVLDFILVGYFHWGLLMILVLQGKGSYDNECTGNGSSADSAQGNAYA